MSVHIQCSIPAENTHFVLRVDNIVEDLRAKNTVILLNYHWYFEIDSWYPFRITTYSVVSMSLSWDPHYK
jgi:hypothetical protein